jgi:hypothetical protein
MQSVTSATEPCRPSGCGCSPYGSPRAPVRGGRRSPADGPFLGHPVPVRAKQIAHLPASVADPGLLDPQRVRYRSEAAPKGEDLLFYDGPVLESGAQRVVVRPALQKVQVVLVKVEAYTSTATRSRRSAELVRVTGTTAK